MKYAQPWGIDDPDASYINGDPSQARMGSIPPAASVEPKLRELVALIEDSQFAPTKDDLEQVAKSVRSQRMNYAEDTGIVNSLTVAFDPPLTTYTIGLPLIVKVLHTSTGPATIDAGAGRVSIRKPNGSEVGAGDLPAAGLIELAYDGTFFEMINFGGGGPVGTAIILATNVPYCVDSSTTKNLVIANFTPAITSYTAGLIFTVKVANTNDSFAYINVNGLGARPIYAQGGSPDWPLLPGDMQVGDVIIFVYDGTAFWINADHTINDDVTFNVANVDQFNKMFAALSRKRISPSANVTIKLGPGNWRYPGAYSGATNQVVLTTYHMDADRITIEGTMQPGQSPPTWANISRHDNTPEMLAYDAYVNLLMYRAHYATEIDSVGVQWGIQHVGPGAIKLKNIFHMGGAGLAAGGRGFSCDTGAQMRCYNCCSHYANDVGFACVGTAVLYMNMCFATGAATRGIAVTGGGIATVMAGATYGNTGTGIEVSHGAIVQTGTTTLVDANGAFVSGFNGAYGMVSQSGNIDGHFFQCGGDGVSDVFAFNNGFVSYDHAIVFNTSPFRLTVGNLNSLILNYGPYYYEIGP